MEGYVFIARRDRDDGHKLGGVASYARHNIASRATLLEWKLAGCGTGHQTIASTFSLEAEWGVHSKAALGTVVVGEMDVHHIQWLRFSSKHIPKTPRAKLYNISEILKVCDRLSKNRPNATFN